MFGFFRRQPSAYAVAIRESMIREPEKWTFSKYEDGTDMLDWLDHTSKIAVNVEKCDINCFRTPRRDRRCIREGIEAWVAWSVSNQKAKV